MSVDPKQRVKQLIIGIQQDCGRYAELQQQLLRQHNLLAAHDVNGLAEHNQQQTQLMVAVQKQAQQRCQHLLALGLKPDEKGMAILIAKLPASLQKNVTSQWQQLEQLLHQCLRQNELNGRLLAGQIETINSLLGQEQPYGQLERFPD
ncbi:lateral flagellar protein LfgN [Aeromonas popoffii]|jgi:flagella synthesis protein FlgN|uniref:Lateral flagellar protein LfgN n=1 Tax=Aeromonas popoffii TaxID=70856 RepID=A0ABS5GPH0_9GAMM|nr:lateral flagellar protein LfgN [Aeromonas popoffii]MBR7628997.1 lateral flagellar protein LfgN [Aeromonas popoffii]